MSDNKHPCSIAGCARTSSCVGEQCPWSKLTRKQVDEIRSLPAESTSQLAQRYGVSKSTIVQIRAGKIWK